MTRRLGNDLMVGATLALTGCAVNPATGERQLILVSQAQEIAMGREADPQIVAGYGLVDDPDLQRYVSDLGLRMAAETGDAYQDLPWSFKVVDDPIVNAFALPGGFIYVTRGILANFDSEAELAGVLGHEIGHVTARHSAEQMSRQRVQAIALGAAIILWEPAQRYGQVGAAALGLLNLRYSRTDESQSDALGLEYMTGLGYDPDEMIGVFDMLAQAGNSGSERLPEWQLSHPYPENREADMRALIAESGLPRSGEVNRERYLDAIDGIVYGDDPRQGFFRGSLFLHPELAFSLDFPSGWTTVNQRSVVAGIAPDQDAVLSLELVQDGASPRLEINDFLRGEGVSGGTVRESSSGGIERAEADFDVTDGQNRFSGRVAFVRQNGVTYRLLGYAAAADWRGYASAVTASIASFDTVTDQAVLDVQPQRLDIVTVPEAMSINSYYQRFGAPILVEELARLNRTAPGAVLSAGSRIKTVVGDPAR